MLRDAASDDPDLIPAGPPVAGESIPPGEEEDIRAIVGIVEARLREAAAKERVARRDAHAKGHGCVRAEFRVLDDLPPELRQGLFAEPRNYSALIRFSNGAGEMAPDAKGDSRGMAIKLLGVEGSCSGTQDFVLVDHPVFVIRNVADYLALQTSSSAWRFFAPSLLPPQIRLHELLLTLAIQRQKVQNPLSSRYWSMAPFLFGATTCKFSARPAGPPSPFAERAADDYLGRNLERHLSEREASFDLLVQRRAREDRMPVEDATIEWREHDAPFRPVARITVPPQLLAERRFCEDLSFTPWHGLPAHRPVGGINRVRREVYTAISRLRHEMNGALRQEPVESDFAPKS